MNRKLRMGMIGGGKDAFIGAIHRYAANMDGLIEVSAGALSINPEIAVDSGKMLFLPQRPYMPVGTLRRALSGSAGRLNPLQRPANQSASFAL